MERILLTDDERYQAMAANLATLKARRETLEAESATLAQANAGASRGASLVVGLPKSETTPSVDPVRLAGVRRELAEVESAIALQTDLLKAERSAASARLCPRLLPDYSALAGVIGTAAKALADAVAAERAFVAFHQGNGLELVYPLRVLGIDPASFGVSSSLSRLIDTVAVAVDAMPKPTTAAVETVSPAATGRRRTSR